MLVGQQFGKWTVYSIKPKLKKYKKCIMYSIKCQCVCKTIRYINKYDLVSGRSTNCGCVRNEKTKARNTIHGLSSRTGRHLIYGVWAGMKNRCTNTSHVGYKDYGGRGIKVCDRWLKFENFRDDMLSSWKKGLQLDRINNDGNYETKNCRWVNSAQNRRNRRRVATEYEKGFIDGYTTALEAK